MANMDRPKKMLVRTAFVTGTTVATLMGAQTLALIDQRSTTPQASSTDNAAMPQPSVEATSQLQVVQAAPTITIVHVAPSIVILREPGQAGTGSTQMNNAQQQTPQTNTVVIQPPSPVQLSAPAPIIVQQPGGSSGGFQSQPAPATTRSSR